MVANLHMKSEHKEKKNFQCFTCDRKFYKAKTLSKHIATAHIEDKSSSRKTKIEAKELVKNL